MKSQHEHKSTLNTQNQNNAMSKRELKDGSRNSKTLGKDGDGQPVNASPEAADQHDKSTLDAFGEAGAGVDSKE